ncbi:xanthine dehydrogenase family protein molybdopterin-binding subunit [Saxibacter everestensis]|uniref:Xanthine dehydrogenase family protein molybdopterin-binding subunit n=1 Tax=Saxibacter everestensis TaxID=2909229 RepID=A0ABY8QYK0_9MICO|nr:xanthine dehydrogenase family protein molybdopterin-binding subunit [Brevibacteriaceae bacterium ZFBP1038]
MNDALPAREIGRSLERIDGRAKVTGAATYAYEHEVESPLYLFPAQATIARGRIISIDTADAEAIAGVHAVLTHLDAPELASTEDAELAVLQSGDIGFRGQFIAAVLAESPEIARQAAGAVKTEYEPWQHDADLRPDRGDLHPPGNDYDADTSEGDVAAALAAADVSIDQTYTTPAEHNNPMEPHATIAVWQGEDLTLYDSTQSVHGVRKQLATVFGIDPERVRVICPHVGGGFGSKGLPHAHVVLAALAAKFSFGRPVKFALTRQQMFALAGYRTPTIQRVRLGADSSGRLGVITHDSIELTSRIKEFPEGTTKPTAIMYKAPNRRATERLADLDVAVPSWMRAPGECPGMFGPEVAMDELAEACGLDPVELRVRNEPDEGPVSGKPFVNRHLVNCFREGARRFGWDQRDPRPRSRREGDWLIGTGMAAATYPALRTPGSIARITVTAEGTYQVRIGSADLGTGAWTVLSQIAADALGCSLAEVSVEIGDTSLPTASVAGGSTGTVSWGSAIIAAADALQEKYGDSPQPGDEVEAEMPMNPADDEYERHSFGAQFAEVAVNADTGEIRARRLLGVFSAGRIINVRTARSQLIGGMTMGLGMALHEESVLDQRFGHFVNHDLAGYHVPSNADVLDVDAVWLDEHDEYAGPLGARGIGEIGITGVAAAIANAAYHATGIRVRDLPLTADKFLR